MKGRTRKSESVTAGSEGRVSDHWEWKAGLEKVMDTGLTTGNEGTKVNGMEGSHGSEKKKENAVNHFEKNKWSISDYWLSSFFF